MAKAGETQDRCTQYALDVVSGKITAGEYVRLACQRHLDDIEKSKAAPYKYYFDVEKSEEIINFAEELTIAEGEENEHVTAYPFQCFILGSLNGWRTKEKSYRRFRTSYVQLGRQNGKSFINGILACYYGNFDGYKYGKIFCTATKQDQANIVFDEVAKFINSDEDLSEWFKVHDHNHTIDCLLTHSEIKALSGDTKSLDGHRAYLGIVDEYHAHKTNQMYKLLEGGIKKLKSALISVITTAGFDLKSPCYKLYEYCCNLLKGVFENDSQFVYIAQMDEHDDRYTPENWIKANPILEFDRDALENLIPIAHTARDMGGEDLRDFLVKQLNMWMQWSNSLYIKDIASWKACAVLKSLKDFRGSKCYVGVDLSSGGDLTSIAIVIPFMVEDTKKYFVHTHSFIPSSRVDEHIKTDKVPYDVWIEKGLVTVTETLGGIKTDYKYIIKYLEDLLKQINDKKNEVKSLVNDGKLDKARAAKEELVELQNRFDLLYDLDEDEQDGIENKVKDGTAKQVGGDVKPDKKNIVKSFVNIVKAGFLHKEADETDIKVYKDALTSDTTAGSEGEVGIGVTIPEDIRTDIIELRRSSDNLEQYVNVEGVTTKTGTRNIEVDAESTPFDNVDEAADFPEMDEPEFLPIEYKVKKKGGILKMTAELLEDTASNIMAYINKWIAKKTKATRNAMILKVLNEMTKGKEVTVENLDSLKDIFNEQLDPAIADNAVVITNQSGFNYLDGSFYLQSIRRPVHR